MSDAGYCTCDQTTLALKAGEDDLDVLPPVDDEEKQMMDDEEELPLEEEEELEMQDDEEELPLEDEEELPMEEEEEKDAGKLVSLLEEALSYLKGQSSEGEVSASMQPEKSDEMKEAMKVLRKNGVNVYAGRKRTPAPSNKVSAPTINWLDFNKGLEEIDRMVEKAGRN